MKKGWLFIICILIGLRSQPVLAQSAKQFSEKGMTYVEQGDYYAAYVIYKQAIEKFPDNVDFRFQYAEALRQYNNYEDAATAYKDLITDDKDKKYATARYYYALMLKQQGKYDVALREFERFKKTYKQKEISKEQIEHEYQSCQWALENNKEGAVKIEHLEIPVNTPYSDFNPFTSLNGELIFTSLRPQGSKLETNIMSRFYTTDSTESKLIKAITIFKNKHLANGHFSEEQPLFYFNVCETDATKRCAIYVSKFENENWSAPTEVQGVNSSSYTATQPCLIAENGVNYLYFSSDRQGTIGGMDIWRAKEITFEKFAYPENATSINTAGNEYSIGFWKDSSRLFFASDGWFGYGGLDIFSMSIMDKNATPVNLGLPISSPANDFGYQLSADKSIAYFASNRKGSMYIKAQTCCYDIWQYKTGVTPIGKTKTPIDTTVVSKDSTVWVVTEGTLEAKKDLYFPTLFFEEPSTIKDTLTTRERLTAIAKLLPVLLYFHNDEPECCNLKDSTFLNYATSYEQYIRLIGEYKENYPKALPANKKSEAAEEVLSFFQVKVEKGFYDLITLSAYLLDALESDKRIKLTIKGYCSPLNYNLYNIHLGNRRVSSLQNYFNEYRNAVFVPYINSGNLVIETLSLGEEQAQKGLSDDRLDMPNSVYNPSVAVERRVEIVSVEIE